MVRAGLMKLCRHSSLAEHTTPCLSYGLRTHSRLLVQTGQPRHPGSCKQFSQAQVSDVSRQCCQSQHCRVSNQVSESRYSRQFHGSRQSRRSSQPPRSNQSKAGRLYERRGSHGLGYIVRNDERSGLLKPSWLIKSPQLLRPRRLHSHLRGGNVTARKLSTGGRRLSPRV